METKFEAGQTVYNEQGEQAEYVAQAGDGHIVRPVVEAYSHDGESGPYDHVCDPTIWRSVFPSPPVAKFNEDLKAIHDKITAANKRLAEVREEERLANASSRERLDRLAKIEQLRYIEDFLDGKLTHYAVFGDCNREPEVIKADEAWCGSDGRRDGKVRLFCLYGDQKNRSLEWHLHHYSDSSGAMYSGEYIPARSQEEAEDIIRRELGKRIQKASVGDSYLDRVVESAVKWGLSVPQPLLDEASRIKEFGRSESIRTAHRDFERAKQRLAELGVASA